MSSWMNTILNTYGELWQMIIRPPRCVYTPEDLGPRRFRLSSSSPRVYVREDLQLRNDRGQRLECSHFRPERSGPGAGAGGGRRRDGGSSLPCVVYLHGNCSSRLEAFDVLEFLLPLDLTVFCFDFSGSGRSDGEYISLGYYERLDLRAVMEHLRGSDSVSAVALWGRSMGAATAVLGAASDATIAACVADSPFSSLRMVAEELVNSGMIKVPAVLLNMALAVVRKEVHSRAGFNIDDLLPIKSASRAIAPVLFATANDDKVVLPHHAADLIAAWGSEERQLVTFEGGHNCPRPSWFLKDAAAFLEAKLLMACNKRTAMPVVPLEAASTLESSTTSTTATIKELPIARRAAAHVPATAKGASSLGTLRTRLAAVATPARRKGSSTALASTSREVPRTPVEPLEPEAEDRAGNAVPSGGGVAAALAAMGFGADVCGEAARRHPTVQAALEWILRQSAQAVVTIGNAENHPPASSGHGLALMDALPGQVGDWEDAETASGAQPGRIVRQLTELGLPPSQAGEAARRCSSAEAAVEWLAERGEL